MEKYNIIIEQPAQSDLRNILSYISENLSEATTAMRIYHSIKSAVLSLDEMPYRCKVVDDEPFHSLGIRKLAVENYTAFYFIDEESKEVHIFRILYNRREWRYLI